MKRKYDLVAQKIKSMNNFSYYILWIGFILTIVLLSEALIAKVAVNGLYFTNRYFDFLSSGLVETAFCTLLVGFIGFFISDYIFKKDLSNNDQ